jgi:hypothetical protein
MEPAYGGFLLFAGELHVDSAVFIACASEPVISKHLWASNTAGQVWERPDCHRSGQVWSLVWSTAIPAPFLIMMAMLMTSSELPAYQSSSGGRAVTSRHTLHVEGGVSMVIRQSISLNFQSHRNGRDFEEKITLQH